MYVRVRIMIILQFYQKIREGADLRRYIFKLKFIILIYKN